MHIYSESRLRRLFQEAARLSKPQLLLHTYQRGQKLKINLAHIRHPAASGGHVDFAVFDARSNSGSSGNPDVLANLTMKARASGLKIDQSALAFTQGGQLQFFGDTHLVDFLSENGLPQWTHSIDV